MEICSVSLIGLCLATFGALFSAVPWQGFDYPIRCLYPKFRQANSGLERLQQAEDLNESDKELAALIWFLKIEAQKLSRRKDDGIFAEATTGIVAPADQLIDNEKGEPVGALNRIQMDLDRRIRDNRAYAGLSIIALGFILQIVGAFLC